MLMKIKLRKLWKGLASIRDYMVRDCLAKSEALVFEYNGELMTILPDELRSKMFQAHHYKNQSKFKPDQTYELIDFKFVSDEKRKKLEEKKSSQAKLF